MINEVRIYDERTGIQVQDHEAYGRTLQRALNYLIQEHNALVEAVALYAERPLARAVLGIESGPLATERGREKIEELLRWRRDPNPEVPAKRNSEPALVTSPTRTPWAGDVSGSGIDLRADAARETDHA